LLAGDLPSNIENGDPAAPAVPGTSADAGAGADTAGPSVWDGVAWNIDLNAFGLDWEGIIAGLGMTTEGEGGAGVFDLPPFEVLQGSS
ncbi:hypothetical protein EW146_g7626, partial [Bondarzewia mesenterica]